MYFITKILPELNINKTAAFQVVVEIPTQLAISTETKRTIRF